MPKAAIIQSVFDFAIREINALEQRIVKAEDNADAMLWEQAEQVVAQLDAHLSQRKLAAQWINARTGNPYDHKHVTWVARVWRDWGVNSPRPRFRDAYNEIANQKNKLDVHHSSESAEHYTPKELLDQVVAVMGAIDLDPCSHPDAKVPARRRFTAKDDGLTKTWSGRVFVNPPYGRVISEWTIKIRQEWERGDVQELIALLPARHDTEWWDALTRECDDVVACFWSGRLTFGGNTDPAPFPSCVVYFGPKHDVFARVFNPHGGLWVRPPIGFFVDHA